MSNQDKSAKSDALHGRIAGAVFTVAESMGISDRDVKEKLARLTIERLERGEAGMRMTFVGMEELVPRGGGVITDNDVKRLVKEALQQMGDQSESPAAPPTPPAAHAGKPEAIAAPAPVDGFSPNALRVLEKRYLKKDAEGKVIETPADMLQRVAHAIAAAELIFDPAADAAAWEERFYQAMAARDFLPNSPTLMNAGRELGQLSACFVLPVEDTMESIFDAVKYTALIHKSGGGTGFSFNRLRPENDRVGSTGGVASGPVSFIRAFDTATEVIKQGGMRRGANMAVLNVDHPDILKFISAKEGSSAFNNFNFSVAITEGFMKAVEADAEYDLVNPRTGKPSGKLKARQVFDTIVDKAWKTGDPGIVFLDRINRDNPVPKLGKIESTNPCGEQPLLPYESCNLGSINLARMLRSSGEGHSNNGSATEIDYARLAEMVRLAVRFLDDVIEVNVFPLPEIERRSKATRKIGLGVMGFADMLIKLGVPYDSQEGVDTARRVMQFINAEALSASRELAEKRGPFPAFKKSVYFRPGEPLLRNATRTTIAPTGTLSIIADCSSGVEPLFALSYTRTILEGEQLIEVNPYFREAAQAGGFYSDELVKELAKHGSVRGMNQAPAEMQRVFVTAHDITPEWHVKMQAAFQESTDNAVSKTVNFPHNATREDVAQVFRLAYELGCKGVTIYRDRSKESQVLSFGDAPQQAEAAAAAVSPAPRSRPRITTGFTKMVQTGCGHIYVTVNRDERGICEVFSSLGKSGGCAAAQLEAISRLTSVALRSGIDRDSVVKHLRGIRCPSIAWEEGHAVLSCPDAIASVLEQEVEAVPPVNSVPEPAPVPAKAAAARGNGAGGASAGLCPECSNVLVYQEGCHYCLNCGYTKC